MQRVCLLILLALLWLPLGTAAWGQDQKTKESQPAAATVQGVKIRSIIMAPDRKSATIEIVNESEKTVTAFAYAYDITLTDGEHSKGEKMQERIGDIVFAEAGLHTTPLPDQHPIKPGEIYSEVFGFSQSARVAGLAVTMEVVIYADLTSESTNQWVLDNFIAQRTDQANLHSLAADAIAASLQDEHPFKSAHDRLLNTKHSDTDLRNLEPGYGRNFTSADEERKYLANELAEHRSLAAALTTHAKIVRHQ